MKYFSYFRFDESERKLWSGANVVPLTRKAADLLACLVHHSGATVSHQNLMQWVWPETHVQQDNIKVLVHELRHALGDSPTAPRFVESESGRGYSFVAAVADAPCPLLEGPANDRPPLITRDQVLLAIEGAVDRAVAQHEPAYLFLEGLAGSGKTSVCREVHRRAVKWPTLRTACGRAHRTSSDPFPALVDVLDRLVARYPALVRPILSRRAPTWLAHVGDRRLGIGAELGAATLPENLALELVEALGELGQEGAFLLVLEDLHWSGPRSLDLLSLLASEAIPSSIVVIATYAPIAPPVAHTAGESMPRMARAGDRESPLQLLPVPEAEVGDYLDRRFGRACADALSGPIYSATMGHAGSVARVADELTTAGVVRLGLAGWSLGSRVRRVHQVIADAMIGAIRAQLDGLRPEERKILSTAAGVGWEFTDQAVAEALGAENPGPLGGTLDLLARHLPVFERVAPVHGSQGALSNYRFRHRQWFDTLRGQATMAHA